MTAARFVRPLDDCFDVGAVALSHHIDRRQRASRILLEDVFTSFSR